MLTYSEQAWDCRNQAECYYCDSMIANPPFATTAQSSPVTSNKVVEYRERNLRPFLYMESLQIIQSLRSSLLHSPQGTEMAMAEA